MIDAPGCWSVRRECRDYPACLDELDEPERPLLYGAGRREAIARLDHESTVTIVGARRATGYGLRFAEHLARALASAGVTVVSGMARGIDSAAHRGALGGGGITVAVLANGPDIVYPPVNRPLYQRIIRSGAAISEHPPGTEARKQHFPARNRIMAALGRVVVIVEAAQPSGSLITADVAAKLGRTVGAVPGQVGVGVAAGTNQLLKDGAHVIRDVHDVLDLLYGVGVGAAGRSRAELAAGPQLDPALRTVLELVESGAGTIDRVAATGGLAARDAAVALARLEQLGYVAVGPLGEFARSPLAPSRPR